LLPFQSLAIISAMKEALIVVDFQKDFVDGSLGFEKARQIRGSVVKAIESALARKADLIFTFDTHDQSYLDTHEGHCLPVKHALEGTEGWKLDSSIAAFLGKARFTFTKNAFGSMELGRRLAEEGYDKVELCGLVLDICVLANAVIARASLPEADILVNLGASAGLTEEKERSAASILQSQHIRAEVIK
jgi:nicotinamidase/pyrazinamidase